MVCTLSTGETAANSECYKNPLVLWESYLVSKDGYLLPNDRLTNSHLTNSPCFLEEFQA